MANKLYNEDTIKSIANAIRAKNGTTTEYHVADMPTAIANINTNPAPSGSVNITTNGVHEEIAGKAKAIVNVPSDVYEPDTIVANGTYTPTGHAGFSKVVVNINDAPELQAKTVEVESFPLEVVPDAGYYGLNKVTVNYSPSEIQEGKSTTVTFGTTTTIEPDTGFDAMGSLTVTATAPSGNQDINANGTYDITSKAQVTVNVTPEPLTTETLTATSNGTYTPTSPAVAFDKAIVNVPEPVLVTKSVTENGTYTPASGEDGFSSVSVNVPTTELETFTTGRNGTFNAPSGKSYNKVIVNVPANIPNMLIEEFDAQDGFNDTYTEYTGLNGNLSNTFTMLGWVFDGTHETTPNTILSVYKCGSISGVEYINANGVAVRSTTVTNIVGIAMTTSGVVISCRGNYHFSDTLRYTYLVMDFQ